MYIIISYRNKKTHNSCLGFTQWHPTKLVQGLPIFENYAFLREWIYLSTL